MDKMVLVSNALEIVKSYENISVLAGPGSGKTELLAQRASFLLQTKSCPFPYRILAISFKRDSATNLEYRALLRCGIELISRFDSLTIDAFTKGILDRFRLALPEDIRPIENYKIQDKKKKILNDNKYILSFKRIQYLATWLIKNNKHLRNAIKQTYKYVLLDEFQDTTATQYNFIKESFMGSSTILTAVGDIKQSIMIFAGAEKKIFEKFEQDFGAKRIPLLINYRSKKKLQYIQSFFAEKLDPNIKIRTEYQKNDEGDCKIFHFSNSEKEAEIIALEIKKHINKGISPEQICIIYRRKDTRNKIDIYREKIIQKLDILGIPARFEDIYQKFLNEPIIKLVISFIRLSLKEQSIEDWNNIYNLLIYIKGFNEDTKLGRYQKLNMIIYNLSKALQKKFLMVKNIQDLSKIYRPLINIFGIAELSTIYPQYLSKNYLKQVIDKFNYYFWQQYQIQKDWSKSLESLLGTDIIPIMTVHKSKGLEFEVVIFIGLEDNAFFSYQRNRFSELCTFFVALSRAKSQIYFTNCDKRENSPQSIKRIKEIYDIFAQSGIKQISL